MALFGNLESSTITKSPLTTLRCFSRDSRVLRSFAGRFGQQWCTGRLLSFTLGKIKQQKSPKTGSVNTPKQPQIRPLLRLTRPLKYFISRAGFLNTSICQQYTISKTSGRESIRTSPKETLSSFLSMSLEARSSQWWIFLAGRNRCAVLAR